MGRTSADTAKQTFLRRTRESEIGLKKINQSVTMKSDRTNAGKGGGIEIWAWYDPTSEELLFRHVPNDC